MEIYSYSCIGIEEQNAENPRKEIENAGYRVAHWFADDATAGFLARTEAPQFTAMMHRINAGDVLVVTKLHHLGCNAADVLTTIQALNARQIGIIVLELGNVNLASDAGKPVLNMLNAVVEMGKNQQAAPAQPHSEPQQSEGRTSGRAARLSRELREMIITEYSQGISVSELALRHNVSRARIQGVVAPKRKRDEPLPFAWGD